MNTNFTKSRRSGGHAASDEAASVTMSQIELARLGGGHVAYIKTMTSDEAQRMFPAVQELPSGINLYALHAADGTPIALTDTRQAALTHAMEGDLSIATLH